jgi:ATPase subunit of ABC transporter with duplicated ATPase domains
VIRAPSLLAVRDLGYDTPDGRPLVRGLSFAINHGEALVVSGQNGSGKSTLLGLLAGQNRAVHGVIDLRTKSLGFLSQLHNREFHIPVTLSDVLSFGGVSSSNARAALDIGLLSADELGLGWNTASGGERQKTLITRFLLMQPELLILDEPANHLDFDSRKTLCRILRKYIEDGRRSLIMVCHESALEDTDWNFAPAMHLGKYAVTAC